MGMTFADLFAGIGGFRLGLERAGMTCKWACEIDPFCRQVYLKHWPNTEPFYEDIRTITNPPAVDLVCGGFPCQPFSVAGKRKGAEDDRNLWPEMLRVIDLVRPSWVLGENVPGIGGYLDTVVSDLESRGFEVVPLEIEAAAVGANHRRARVWIVAKSTGTQRNAGAEVGGTIRGVQGNGAQSDHTGRSGSAYAGDVADAKGEQGHGQGPRGLSTIASQCGENVADARCEGVQQRRITESTQELRGESGRIRRNGLSQEQVTERQVLADTTGPRLEGPESKGIVPGRIKRLPAERGTVGRGIEPGLGRGFDGISSWLDGSWEYGVPRVATGVQDRVNRLKALGNAVVPQVVEWIGRRIIEAHKHN